MRAEGSRNRKTAAHNGRFLRYLFQLFANPCEIVLYGNKPRFVKRLALVIGGQA